MTGSNQRKMVALYGAISTFLILIFTMFLYVSAQSEEKFFEHILGERIFGVPLLLYLLGISLFAAIILFLIITFTQKGQAHRLEEKIHLLATGTYENAYLSRPITQNDPELQNIDRDIMAIAAKLQNLSQELQVVNARPEMVDGVTKEEILTQERHRLARELHDSVSQQLFAAMMMLSALTEQSEKQELPDGFKKQLALVASIINTSQSEMRALLLHLRPTNLEGKSLKKGIEQLLKELQNKIQIGLKWEAEDVKLPQGVEDHLFRIVQELLSNTLRHAKANTLEVYLHEIGNNVLLRFVDDGVGFDTEDSKAGSYGLTNIKERVAGLGGTVKIISFKGQGTSVEIKIPRSKEEKND
ncbi:sensor histidine kinase [Enterococcus timonensis]|uniref:sensor histidine kinase n=1 Tax=Enterococcus timonensis TaxID=1852364 RepID=UPI0008DA43DD|nr:sensor histidine kinase [Enterococcus timonensis]